MSRRPRRLSGRARRRACAAALLSPCSRCCRSARTPAARSKSRWPTRCARRCRRRSPTARRPSRCSTTPKQRLVYLRWLGEMSERLKTRKAEHAARVEFLETLWYESKRAGLEPSLVLGLVQVESGFRKYAISSVGRARLHAGDAVLGPPDRRRRCEPAVPHADQPALRLRDPAPLPRPWSAATCSWRSAATTAAAAAPEYPNAVFAAQRLWVYKPPSLSHRPRQALRCRFVHAEQREHTLHRVVDHLVDPACERLQPSSAVCCVAAPRCQAYRRLAHRRSRRSATQEAQLASGGTQGRRTAVRADAAAV